MGQRVTNKQFNIMVNGVEYKNCYFRSGNTAIAVTAATEQDRSADTGQAKFPNNLLAWGVAPSWVNASWDTVFRGGYVSQGATNLTVGGNWHSGAAQNVEVAWWALGN